jgi:TPR repeat protein
MMERMLWLPVWIMLLLPATLLASGLEAQMRMAEQGNPQAQRKVGQVYYEGKGVQQDYRLAMHWFRLAAEQGDAEAQNGVGTLYDNGKGVPRDYQEAARWFRLAAEQGHVLARRNLGWMHEKGQGFEKNLVLAYQWQSLAQMAQNKRRGEEQSCRLCATLAQKMTPEQVAQAEESARRWRPGLP